jgi:hypothetical protein
MRRERKFDLGEFQAQTKPFLEYAGDKEGGIMVSCIEEEPEYAGNSRTLS